MADSMKKANEMGKSIPPSPIFVIAQKQGVAQALDDIGPVVFHVFNSSGELKKITGFGGPTWSGDMKLELKLNNTLLVQLEIGSFALTGDDVPFLSQSYAEGDRLIASVLKAGTGGQVDPFSILFGVESG